MKPDGRLDAQFAIPEDYGGMNEVLATIDDAKHTRPYPCVNQPLGSSGSFKVSLRLN